MSRVQREENLTRLCREIQNIPAPIDQLSDRAKKLSESLFLANSSTKGNFAEISKSWQIASKRRVAADGGVPVSPTCCESILGTANDVFFYVAPFRYPHTSCGLLFATTLEADRADDGIATPFDSGGLIRPIERSGASEPVHAFLARHELPIPQHRLYLEHSLRLTFRSPEDYLDSNDRLANPLGLSGGDSRMWTHEVRIPERVHLRAGHLQAAFASTSAIGASRPIETLFAWCERQGVDTIVFENPAGDDFDQLRRQSLEYIRRRVY
jgi:hypothetical protein